MLQTKNGENVREKREKLDKKKKNKDNKKQENYKENMFFIYKIGKKMNACESVSLLTQDWLIPQLSNLSRLMHTRRTTGTSISLMSTSTPCCHNYVKGLLATGDLNRCLDWTLP